MRKIDNETKASRLARSIFASYNSNGFQNDLYCRALTEVLDSVQEELTRCVTEDFWMNVNAKYVRLFFVLYCPRVTDSLQSVCSFLDAKRWRFARLHEPLHIRA